VKESLLRMQQFDPASLSRKDDLGKQLNFEEAVLPARRLVELYKRLSTSALDDFPGGQLTLIKNVANADYSRFKSILDFSSEQENPQQARAKLIEQVRGSYDATFQQLWQFIAYGVSKTVDSQRLENESRAVLQSIQDQAAAVTTGLQKDKETSQTILADIRKVAAEHGVSQQAHYFKLEADTHESSAVSWEGATRWWALATGGFALVSIFLHKLPWLSPQNGYEAAQMIAGKVLLFAVLGYMLILAGRNFLAHKHNAVVNRHRQNALLTYKSISDAAKSQEKQDIILSHAASCIFAPQDTGYQHQRSSDSPAVSKTIVETVTRSAAKSE
jgi:hypothetical protein